MIRSIIISFGNVLSVLYAKLFLITVVRKNGDRFDGPKIFVVNHPNTLDPFYLLGILPKRIVILITQHVFAIPVLGGIVRRAGHISVTDNKHDVYEQAKKMLLSGRSILIFPEGNVSHMTGMVKRFHTGAIRLSLETKTPIVPIGIYLDRTKIWRRSTIVNHIRMYMSWYVHGWYTVVFGIPIHVSGSNVDRSYVRKETRNLRRVIISTIHEAKVVASQDMIVHKRTIKKGWYTGLHVAYRVCCFIGFLVMKTHETGVKLFG